MPLCKTTVSAAKLHLPPVQAVGKSLAGRVPSPRPRLRAVLWSTVENSSWIEPARHPYEELCLVTGGEVHAILNDRPVWLKDGSLVWTRAGTSRGSAQAGKDRPPQLWMIGFEGGEETALLNPGSNGEPARVWGLLPDQVAEFRSVFVKLASEAVTHRTGECLAESAWLRLLLVMVRRWSESRDPAHISAKPLDPELVRLWKRVGELVYEAGSLSDEQLRDYLPNYDSLRHRFQKTFGVSPHKMLMSLRMEAAKNLLLGSAFSVKEIAEKLGYARQHEFCRAFKKLVGQSPTQWKSNPLDGELNHP